MRDEIVPKKLIAPEVPLATGLKVRREIGLLLFNMPNSVAQVSALAAAKEVARPIKNRGLLVI